MKTVSVRSFDIETGAQPEARALRFYNPPPPFDVERCKAEFATARDPKKGEEFIAKKTAEAEAEALDSRAKFLSDCALRAHTGRVLAIGYHDGGSSYPYAFAEADFVVPEDPKTWPAPPVDDTPEALELARDEYRERMLLAHFWKWSEPAFTDAFVRLCGWNSHDFDLPFLVQRSYVLGVALPRGLRSGRYWNRVFVDLMKVWTCDVYGARFSLDNAAKALGIGGKSEGVTGADFSRLYFGTPEERKQAIAYLRNDLNLTQELGLRLVGSEEEVA